METSKRAKFCRWRAFFIFALLQGCFTGQSQVLRQLSIKEGLSQGFVPAVAQSRDGYIWAATLNGLNRYDGEQFICYLNKPEDQFSLYSNRVVHLSEDRNDYLWVSTPGSLQYYDPGKDKFITPNSFLQHPFPDHGHIGFDQQNGLWVTRLDTLIYYQIDYSTDEKHEIKSVWEKARWAKHAAFNFNTITAVFVDDTSVFVGTKEGNVFSLSINSGATTQLPITIKGIVKQVWVDPTFGGLWVQGTQEAIIWKNNQLRHIPLITTETYPNCFGVSANGLTWLASGNRVYSWNDTLLTPVLIPLPQNILSLVSDHQGSLWIGTNTAGLYQMVFNHHSFSVLDKGICNVLPLTIDSEDRKWIFQKSKPDSPVGFISELRPDGTIGRKLNTDPVYQMCVDFQGKYWSLIPGNLKKIGYYNFPGDTCHVLRSLKLPKNASDLFCTGTDLVIVTGTEGALLFYNYKTGHSINIDLKKNVTPPLLSNFNFSDVVTDSRGHIWMGCNNGLFELWFSPDGMSVQDANQTQAVFKHPFRLSETEINDLCIDSTNPNLLWIGTRNGLIKFDLTTYKGHIFTQKDGLPDNYVFSLQMGSSGELWLGTGKGLTEFNPVDFSWRTYTEQDGLPSSEFNTAAAVRDRDGVLYFNSTNGIVVFQPDKMVRPKNTSVMHITGISMGNTMVINRPPGDRILQFKYNENAFTIHFALLNYIKSEENRYEYKLEGHDDNWVNTGKNNAVSYAHLPPGAYTFWVRGANSGAVWGEPAQIHFIITPPWWKTTTAYIFYFLVAGIALFLGIRHWKMIDAYQRDLFLSEQSQKYHTEMEQFRVRLLSNITHEIRTPLTIIKGLADRLKNNQNQEVKEQANAILGCGDELLELSDQIIQLTKMDEKLFKLHPLPGDISAFVGKVIERFYHFADFKSIHISTDLPKEAVWVDFDERVVKAIVGNLLSNAIKFAPAGGKVQVRLAYHQDREIELIVSDNGIGIPKADFDKVFERFYQAANSNTYCGSGIGLTYVKELLTQMNGSVSLESTPGAGSIFVVKFPCTQVAPANAVIPPVIDSPKSFSEKTTQAIPTQDESLPLVLLVEDNATVAAFIQASIQDYYRVTIAFDGLDGMRKALELIPDLIITDVMMPGMDGWELCQTLKNNNLTSHIPVLMLTSLADSDNRIEGIRRGANAYISKPFQQEELLLCLQNLLNLSRSIQAYLALRASNTNGHIALPDIEVVLPDMPKEEIHQEDQFVAQVLQLIEQNFSDSTFDSADIMREINISKTQLHRKMLALTGNTAGYYLRQRRIRESVRLLQEFPEMNIAQVAYSSGFNNPNYFSTAFSSEFGCSPKIWRQEHI